MNKQIIVHNNWVQIDVDKVDDRGNVIEGKLAGRLVVYEPITETFIDRQNPFLFNAYASFSFKFKDERSLLQFSR
jgi:hypothetical protein